MVQRKAGRVEAHHALVMPGAGQELELALLPWPDPASERLQCGRTGNRDEEDVCGVVLEARLARAGLVQVRRGRGLA